MREIKVVLNDSWAQRAMEVDGRRLTDQWSVKGLENQVK